jgi:hypothetical protein
MNPEVNDVRIGMASGLIKAYPITAEHCVAFVAKDFSHKLVKNPSGIFDVPCCRGERREAESREIRDNHVIGN